MLEVVVESFLEALNVHFSVVVWVEDFLATFSPVLHGESVIEDDPEDEIGSCKICHSDLRGSEEVSLVGVKGLVYVLSNSLNSGLVGLMALFVKLLAHN